jgi:hypothetical protein
VRITDIPEISKLLTFLFLAAGYQSMKGRIAPVPMLLWGYDGHYHSVPSSNCSMR